MPSYSLDMTEDANEDLSYYRAFERKMITDEIVVLLYIQGDPAMKLINLADQEVANIGGFGQL